MLLHDPAQHIELHRAHRRHRGDSCRTYCSRATSARPADGNVSICNALSVVRALTEHVDYFQRHRRVLKAICRSGDRRSVCRTSASMQGSSSICPNSARRRIGPHRQARMARVREDRPSAVLTIGRRSSESTCVPQCRERQPLSMTSPPTHLRRRPRLDRQSSRALACSGTIPRSLITKPSTGPSR